MCPPLQAVSWLVTEKGQLVALETTFVPPQALSAVQVTASTLVIPPGAVSATVWVPLPPFCAHTSSNGSLLVILPELDASAEPMLSPKKRPRMASRPPALRRIFNLFLLLPDRPGRKL